MNVFSFLQDIVSKKQGNLLDDVDNETGFSPYMIQRWLSFFDTKSSVLLNNTANRLYPTFTNKQHWYKFFLTVMPKSRFKKIYYVKKVKEKDAEKKDDQKVIEFLARNHQLSKREVQLYIDILGINLKDLKKKINVSR